MYLHVQRLTFCLYKVLTFLGDTLDAAAFVINWVGLVMLTDSSVFVVNIFSTQIFVKRNVTKISYGMEIFEGITLSATTLN